MTDPARSFFAQALDALKLGDRRSAAALLEQQLLHGNTSLNNLPSVAQLAEHIGEVELAIEAARRAVVPQSTASLIAYWGLLATFDRGSAATADLEQRPAAIRNDPAVLHFRGTLATQFGRFEEAQALFRRALARAPEMRATWFALAMVKTFAPSDPDISEMERLERRPGVTSEDHARICYALGKAWEDCREPDRAFAFYAKGAALREAGRSVDGERFRLAADRTIREFTPENLAKLRRSAAAPQRSLFVTGLPRSGTTLVEQVLRSHSRVAHGGELGLLRAALTPTFGASLARALAYQDRSAEADPWGEIARDYARLVDLRFPSAGRVVDKSLGQSMLTGLLLHALPDARIAWLRRAPEDVALSCFATYFSAGLPWTCSLTDIADHMRAEDGLFAHWREVFPDRIMAVPYEELVASPQLWTERIQRHFGLPFEAGIEDLPREGRAVSTASVGQVGQPISTARIGRAAVFAAHLQPFRERYYR